MVQEITCAASFLDSKSSSESFLEMSSGRSILQHSKDSSSAFSLFGSDSPSPKITTCTAWGLDFLLLRSLRDTFKRIG